MDSGLLIAAGASFVAGLLATIIAKLWIKPIARFSMTKRNLDSALTEYLAQMNATAAEPEQLKKNKQADVTLRSARKHAMDLASCYQADIPYWYRLLLDSRQASPSEALGFLTNLDKIRDLQQVRKRIHNAREAIGLGRNNPNGGKTP